MRIIIPVILLFQVVLGQSVTASVDVNQLAVNETFTLRIEAKDADNLPRVDLSPLEKNFTIISGPAQQTSYQWINGKATSSKTLTWTLVPNQKGVLTIPALKVTLDGKKLKTKPIRMNVKASDQVANKDELFLLAEVDKNEAFVGEQITVTYKLYTRVQMSLEDIKYPESVGFWLEELSVPRPPRFNQTTINGVRYNVATLYKVALFPTKTGELELTPMTVRCNVQVKKRRRQRTVFDDPFFNSFFNETVKKVLRTESTVISVRHYPEGKPAGFTGAVGEFKLSASVDTDNVKANEAVTYTIELNGTGNLNMFSLPDLNFPETMEVFPPTSSFEQKQLWDQFTGTMKWEYILIPRQTGRVFLPRIELSAFNPKDGKFYSISSKSIELHISPAKDRFMSGISGFTKEEITLLGQDIHYNVTTPPTWVERDSRGIPIWVWSSYILAAGFFLAPVTLSRYRIQRLASVGQRISHRALKRAKKSLQTKPDLDNVSIVIYTYLKDRWQLKTNNMDPLTVGNELKGLLPPEVLTELVELLQTCDAARYAPKAVVDQDFAGTALDILQKVDRCT
ncbi:MAG: protein BatD [Candidatus Marinimicrobia bacterium]|nr:protein BatD [Candidatus Neomarinimicrobiota bacterium]